MMDAISKFLESRSDARNTYTSEDNLHMTRDGFMIPPPPPGPENLPILGGNIYQGFDPDVEMSVPVQEVPGKNDPSRRLLELMSPAAELLSKDFGAAFQQYRIAELEKYIDDGTLEPIDYQLAVIENPTVPLGDYYDAAANAFFGVPSDDYILHLGQLYPRRFTDQSSGEEVDLSEDSMLMNLGRYVMSAFMTDPIGVGTSAIAPAVRLVRSAMGDTTDSNVLASGIVPSGVPSTEAADVSDIGFYSAVNRAVEALPMEKGSASQMRSMIAKGEGVKPEEMAWIGLDDFLRGKKSVTKAEVQEYVQANQVQLEEVAYPTRGTVDEFQNSIKDLVAKYEANGGTYVSVNIDDLENPESITFGNKFGNEGDLDDVLEGITPEGRDAAEDILDAFDDFQRKLEVTGDRTKFSEYTLPGGENYREVLLTLPVKYEITELPPNYVVEKITEGMGNRPMYGVKEPGSQYIGFKDSREAAVADALRVINEVQNKTRNTDAFRGGHFDEPNVLAHMRLNDRTGPDGERILFIEEIQSDWHQKGRKAGYKSEIEEPKAYAPDDFDISQTDTQWVTTDRNGVARSVGKGVVFNEQDARKYFARYVSNLEEENYMRARAAQDRQVPDAPMKKTWHEMSFRRVARMAAEEGYDAIAWTPGKMQAQRYDLSKKIDALEYTPLENGQYKIEITDTDLAEVTLPNDGIFDASGLANFVGQEIADKIVRGEGKKLLGVERASDFRYSLTGVDLEVGGEGMKGFYDKMLKNYAAKWGKKFGAKVGVTDIKDVETKVWTLPVTKKMRDSIMQRGVPLFAAGGAAVMSQVEGERNGN